MPYFGSIKNVSLQFTLTFSIFLIFFFFLNKPWNLFFPTSGKKNKPPFNEIISLSLQMSKGVTVDKDSF